MSKQFVLAAAASTLAMAAFAIGAPGVQPSSNSGASMMTVSAAMPAPSYSLPSLLR